MATIIDSPNAPALSSYQTALAILLPPSSPHYNIICNLRSLYDKNYEKWPWPHINVLYPFVAPETLPGAVDSIQRLLARQEATNIIHKHGLKVTLDTSGVWKQKDHATIYLASSSNNQEGDGVQGLRQSLLELFGQPISMEASQKGYTPHLTIGQTSLNEELIAALLAKGKTLLQNSEKGVISWNVGRLVVLQRSGRGGSMRIVSEVLLAGGVENQTIYGSLDCSAGYAVNDSIEYSQNSLQQVYMFSPEASAYIPYIPTSSLVPHPEVTDIRVSTYNILTDSAIPTAPTTARYPLLVSAILSLPATPASILTLQEITDHFLAYLLAQREIQDRYPYTTHSPSHEVLPSLRNCVTLSSIPIGGESGKWEWLDLGKRHKGAVVTEIDIGGKSGQIPKDDSLDNERGKRKKLVIANIHLSCGMTDGSIATKVSQFRTLTTYFRGRKEQGERGKFHYTENWIISGDFNFPTSHATVETAYASKAITPETYKILLSDRENSDGKGFIPEIWQDTYGQTHAQNEFSDAKELRFDIGKENSALVGFGWDSYGTGDKGAIGPGEFGATFNPLTNKLAAEQVKWGANPRPQRYDRILVAKLSDDGSKNWLDVKRTGRFGLEGGSDHWGAFAELQVRNKASENQLPQAGNKQNQWLKVESRDVIDGMTDESLEAFLFENGMIPSPKDYAIREEARELLLSILTNDRGRKRQHLQAPHTVDTPVLLPQIQAPQLEGRLLASTAISNHQLEDAQKPRIKMIIQPVGSYLMNIFTPTSDLDLLCASNISPRVFWVLTRQRIRRHVRRMAKLGRKDGIIRVLRYVEAQSGVMMELEYVGVAFTHYKESEVLEPGDASHGIMPEGTGRRNYRVKIDLQYCQVPERVLDSWNQLPSLPPSDPIFSLSATSLKKLNAYRDASYLLQTIPNLKLFRLTLRALKLWAIRRGIFAARFGYLGGIHLVLLLSRVFKRISPDQVMDLTAGEILKLFFSDYAGFQYEEDTAVDPEYGASGYRRSPTREPMAITTPHAPMVNVAHNASRHTLKTLRDEILLANQRLGRNCGWDAVTGRAEGEAEREFLNSFGNFVKIDIHYWGRNIARGRSLVGWTESRCVNLLVELNAKVPNMHARMWPGRFVNIKEPNPSEELRGFYLIGLLSNMPSPRTSPPNPEQAREINEQKKQAYNRFIDVLRNFEEFLQDEQKKYEVTESYIGVNRVSRQAIGDGVKVDKHVWWDEDYEMNPGEGSYDHTSSTQDDGDEIDSLDEGDDGTSTEEEELDSDEEGYGYRRVVGRDGHTDLLDADDNKSFEHSELQATALKAPHIPLSTARRQRNQQQQSDTNTSIPTPKSYTKKPKLRPAHDIINRIKWDPNINIDDYIIGYEDRFTGTIESDMRKWLTRRGEDETEEDWIPMHRVVWVRRKGDGVKVWDRDARVDMIFGSGVGGGTGHGDGDGGTS